MSPTEAGTLAGAELPRYRCHKEVWAFKIVRIEQATMDGGALLHHDEGYFVPVRVENSYITQHRPRVGGYFVQYKDGYKSFSPAKAFEEGYTRI